VGGRAAVTVRAPAIAVIFHEVFLAASFPTTRSAASGWSDLALWADGHTARRIAVYVT
jgi:hypothetical protein